MTHFGEETWVHSDGKSLIVADTTNGAVHIYDSLGSRIATRDGLAEPRQVAVSGNRAIVLENGRQRLVKFELMSESPDSSSAPKVVEVEGSAKPGFTPTEAEFVDMGLPGGQPCSIDPEPWQTLPVSSYGLHPKPFSLASRRPVRHSSRKVDRFRFPQPISTT